MSDTPRTDEEEQLCRVMSASFGAMVGADFARTLERELAEAILERDVTDKLNERRRLEMARLEKQRDEWRECAFNLVHAPDVPGAYSIALRAFQDPPRPRGGRQAVTLLNSIIATASLLLLCSCHRKPQTSAPPPPPSTNFKRMKSLTISGIEAGYVACRLGIPLSNYLASVEAEFEKRQAQDKQHDH